MPTPPPAPDPVRALAVRAACDLLARLAEGGGAPAEPVPVVLSDGAVEVRITVCRPGSAVQEPSSERPGTGEVVTGEIADQVRRVLRAAERPIKLVTIAARARREPTNHFGDVVRRMVRAGEVRYLRDGHRYWLASRPLPPSGESGQGGQGG